jgi:folate-binding protein YgfZ
MVKAMEKTLAVNDVYEAAHSGAVLVDRSTLGVLKFTGETRLDLINRMSTQAVMNLSSGQGTATILTTDIGRIIDRLLLYASSDAVYCLTGENNGDAIARYLMGFVFFMDDFQVQDLSNETAVLAVYGREAATLMARLFGPAAADLPLHHWLQIQTGALSVYLHRTDPIAGDGYLVMGEAAEKQALWDELMGAGIVPAGEADFEYLRIESRQPRFGHELTQAYIPLEAGLWDDVSFNKGCYTGQEIIARMESRGRIAKKLVQLRARQMIAPGANIQADGKEVGAVTSAANGPSGPLALAYVKTAALEEGRILAAGKVELEVLL